MFLCRWVALCRVQPVIPVLPACVNKLYWASCWAGNLFRLRWIYCIVWDQFSLHHPWTGHHMSLLNKLSTLRTSLLDHTLLWATCRKVVTSWIQTQADSMRVNLMERDLKHKVVCALSKYKINICVRKKFGISKLFCFAVYNILWALAPLPSYESNTSK